MKKAFLAAGTWPAIGVFWVLLKAAGLGLVPSAALALLQAAVFLLVAENEDRTTKLDYAVMFFFLTGLCLAVISEPLGRIFLETNFNFFLFLSLFLAAVLPVIFRAEPFTMAFAKRTTPEAVWTTDLFIKINLIMTLVWAGLFITGALIALIPILWVQLAVPLALVGGIGVPFTIKYPDWHLKAQGLGPLSSLSGDAPPRDTASAPEPGPAEVSSKPDQTLAPVLSPADIDQERLKAVEDLGPVSKILVIQGSPRGKRGHTDTCLDRFLEGVREEGLEPEIFYLHKMNIKPCVGCFNCWVETPGVCVHKDDDMPALLDKIRQADVVVHAFPLYIFTVPGIAKNFLDRSIPLIKPFLVKGADGLTGHPHRGGKPPRLVLMSVCGFPEVEHFQALVRMYRSFSQAGEMPIAGELLRPASEALPSGPSLGSPYQISMDAFKTAGRELVRQGFVSRATELAVSTPLFRDIEAFHCVANVQWQVQIDYAKAKKQGQDLPRLGEYMAKIPAVTLAGMATSYDPDKAGDFGGVIQFDVTGDHPGWHYLEIKDGRCAYHEGRAGNPGVIIHTPWDVWQAVSQGQLSGQDAFMQGKYTAEGDLSLLMGMSQAFGR